MNVALWIAAVFLAGAFLFAGGAKVLKPREELKKAMAWVEDFTESQVTAIGALEVLGAIGLILPRWTDIAPVLTPIAATGLALTMVGAIFVHLRRKEPQIVIANAVLLGLALFVAVGRFAG